MTASAAENEIALHESGQAAAKHARKEVQVNQLVGGVHPRPLAFTRVEGTVREPFRLTQLLGRLALVIGTLRPVLHQATQMLIE